MNSLAINFNGVALWVFLFPSFWETKSLLKQFPPNIITCVDENEGKMIATWNTGIV
jgi:hypothetical protein